MMFPVARTNGRNLFGDLSHDVDRFFNQVLAPVACGALPVDIREEGDNLLIDADVPGATHADLDITVENGTLTLAVHRKAQETEGQPKPGGYFVRERRSGNVSRTFRLPETADLDKIEASLTNGVLTLRIPRKEEAKPRQIQVK